jgi:hypothetical protein
LVDINWTARPFIFILILAFVVSRLPFVNLGFGADADAWRTAMSSLFLLRYHVYQPSRFPGYPVSEFSYSAAIGGGWIATNLLTVVVSLVGVILFARILKDLDSKNKGLLTLTFAFFPILWKDSTVTMDYMWALTFILAAWFFLIRDKHVFAGVLMGLAIGARLTSGMMILPFAYLTWARNRKAKGILSFALPCAVVSLLAFSPLLTQYGLGFLRFYPSSINPLQTGLRALLMAGLIPSFLAVVVLALSSKNLLREIRTRNREIIFLLLAVSVVVVVFLIGPYESDYLIPAIPFGLLLLNRISKARLVAVFCILVVLTSAVAVTPVKTDTGNWGVDLKGLMVGDIESRAQFMDGARTLLDANITDHSVLIVVWYLPVVEYLSYQSSGGSGEFVEKGMEWVNVLKDMRYLSLMPLDQLNASLADGYRVYYVRVAKSLTLQTYGYNLEDYPCIPLSV